MTYNVFSGTLNLTQSSAHLTLPSDLESVKSNAARMRASAALGHIAVC